MSILTATHHDNRAQDPEGKIFFGFVYFNDGLRVTYATGHGVSDSSGGWGAVTQTHVRLATEYLTGKGIPL